MLKQIGRAAARRPFYLLANNSGSLAIFAAIRVAGE
jgi:hypothetical protein